jgi:hypothetical protein
MKNTSCPRLVHFNKLLFCWKCTITNDQTPIKYVTAELKHVLQKGIDSSLYSKGEFGAFKPVSVSIQTIHLLHKTGLKPIRNHNRFFHLFSTNWNLFSETDQTASWCSFSGLFYHGHTKKRQTGQTKEMWKHV